MNELEGRIPIAEPPMIPPAVQAVAASGSSKGAPLFVAADPDLVAKEGVAQDSWFVISHLTSGNNRLDLLVHYIRLTPPQADPMIQAMVSVLDPVSGSRSRKRRTIRFPKPPSRRRRSMFRPRLAD